MSIANTAQAEHWNSGDAIAHWLRNEDRYDRMLQPFGDLILKTAALRPGEQVLDVGCGFGATTLEAARRVAPGPALGVDLSGPMLNVARDRAAGSGLANVAFENGDVQVYPFGPARFDAVLSRFGVMFFEDPVAAFANIRSAVRPGGRLVFACWQPLISNDWLLVPGAALAEHVPPAGFGAADGPGMFAFADQNLVYEILAGSGWTDIQIRPRHVSLLVGGGGSVDDTAEFLRTATIGRTMLAGADEATTERALTAVRAALAQHADAGGVHLGASVWLVQAAAPGAAPSG